MTDGKVSKTAKASAVKIARDPVKEESTEEAIWAIRLNRESGLFELRMDRVDKLLAAYARKHMEQIDAQLAGCTIAATGGLPIAKNDDYG